MYTLSIRPCVEWVHLLWVVVPAAALGQVSADCSDQHLASIDRALKPWIRDGRAEASDSMLSIACKQWPARPGLIIASTIFEPKTTRNESSPGAGDGSKEWVTLLLDKKTAEVVAAHRDEILIDASIRIDPASLVIDTAPYKLAPDVLAFGVRQNIGYSPDCADGGFTSFLTLFVPDRATLRPVFGNPHLTFWRIQPKPGQHPCEPGKADYLRADGATTLRLLASRSHGYHDIELVSTIALSWERENGPVARYPSYLAKTTVRYDGKHYAIPDWYSYAGLALVRALASASAARSRER